MTNTAQRIEIRRYQTTSCHTTGYSWHIEAPDDLRPGELDRLIEAIAEWTDTPKDDHINEILSCEHTREQHDLTSIAALRRVTFSVDIVHREAFVDDVEPLDAATTDPAP